MRLAVQFLFLSAAVAPAAAWAEDSMRIGGQIKLGVESIKLGDSNRPGASPVRMVRESNNTSFWYLDGKESLQPDLDAVFHLEWDFAADTGVAGSGRNFYVGLASERYGRLLMGRLSVYFSHHWFINDTHGSFDAAPNAANSLNVLGTINGAYFAGNFLNNTIRYEFPNLGGFSGMASYSFDAEQAGAGRNHTWYIAPSYTNGDFKAAYFHMERDSQGVLPLQTVGTLDQVGDKIAIGYKWNNVRFGIDIDKNAVTDRLTNAKQSRLAYAIPISYVLGAQKFSLTWGQAFAMRKDGVKMADTGAKMFSISYEYSLSKRTALDTSFVVLNNESNGRYNFWLGGLRSGSQLAAADAGAKTQMLYLGVKHVF